jgi:hypothetical protein
MFVDPAGREALSITGIFVTQVIVASLGLEIMTKTAQIAQNVPTSIMQISPAVYDFSQTVIEEGLRFFAKENRKQTSLGSNKCSYAPQDPMQGPKRGIKTFKDHKAALKNLSKNYGIDKNKLSDAFNYLKQHYFRGGADNVLFDELGNIYDPNTLEWIDNLLYWVP